MKIDILKICLIHLNDVIHGRYDELGATRFIINSQCDICAKEKIK